MIFSDEPRFEKRFSINPTDKQMIGFRKSSTEDHVGPGSYLQTDISDMRNGWKKKSFSKRQPMTPPGATITPYGTISYATNRQTQVSPGPGSYDKSNFPYEMRPSSADSMMSGHSRSSSMGRSQRFRFNSSSVLKDGVLVLGSDNSRYTVGPGSYGSVETSLLKKSHNVRVNTSFSPLSPATAARTPSRPRSRSHSRSPTDIRTPMGSPGSTFRYQTPTRAQSAPRLRTPKTARF